MEESIHEASTSSPESSSGSSFLFSDKSSSSSSSSSTSARSCYSSHCGSTMEGCSRNTESATSLPLLIELLRLSEPQNGESSGSASQNQPLNPIGREQSAMPEAIPDVQCSSVETRHGGFSNESVILNGQIPFVGNPGSAAAPPYIFDPRNQSEPRINFSSSQQNLNLFPNGMDCPPDLIFQLAVDSKGSTQLQIVLADKNPEMTSIILEGLIEHIDTLAVDSNGFNVLIKLIQASDPSQLHKILEKLILQTDKLIAISLHSTGSRLVQRLIQLLKKSSFVEPLVEALSVGFCRLMTDHHGFLVISRCLALLNSKQNKELHKAAVHHCLELAGHPKGCRTLNTFITSITDPYRDHLLHKITNNTVFLAQDPRGNFVIQHILELHHPVFTSKICDLLRGYYCRLCVQKSGSHIVEKCLKSCGMRIAVTDLIMSEKVPQIAGDQFGNYVIQTALKVTKVSDGHLFTSLLETLTPCLANLSYSPNGKNVYKLIADGVPM